MNSGQSMLVIGAFSLLSLLSLSFNRTLFNASVTSLEMETNLDAISLGQSLLDEILAKHFDEQTVDKRAFSYMDVTVPSGFGTDGGEEVVANPDSSGTGGFLSKVKFDDADDYHGYVRWAWNRRFGWFALSVHIDYVNEDDADSVVESPTFYKRVTVEVTHPNMVHDNNGSVIPLVIRDVSVYRRYF